MSKQFEGVKFVAPEGRLVNGHPMIMHDKKNYNTKQVELDKNGQVRRQIMFKVAYPEQVFLSSVWPYLQQAAAQGFAGQPIPQNFKFKIKHCNDLDKKGRRYGEREGCEGCYIVTYSTEGFTPKAFKQTAPNTFIEISDTNEIKTGYHVVVEVVAKHNGNYGDTGGLYVNPNMVLLTRYDSEIFNNSADPSESFGGMGQYVLQGAPQGGAPQNMPNGGGYPQGAPQGGYNAPQGGYNAAPQGNMPQGGYAPHGAPQGGYNALQGAPAGHMPQGGYNAAPQGGYNGAPAGHAPQGHMPNAGYNGAPQGAPVNHAPPAHDLVHNAVHGAAPQGNMPQGGYAPHGAPQGAPVNHAPQGHMPNAGYNGAPQGQPSPQPQAQGGYNGAPQGQMPNGMFPQR